MPNNHLFDDGYDDAKAGRACLSHQVFETLADYRVYVGGYTSYGKVDTVSRQFEWAAPACSGVSPDLTSWMMNFKMNEV